MNSEARSKNGKKNAGLEARSDKFFGFEFENEVSNMWLSQGKRFVQDAYLVSNLTQKDLVDSNIYPKGESSGIPFMQLVEIEKRIPDKISVLENFFDGLFKVYFGTSSRTFHGRYLRIAMASENEAEAQFVRDQITLAVNRLRLKYGLGAALELVEVIQHDILTGQRSRGGPPNLVQAHGDGRDTNEFYQNAETSGFVSSGPVNLNGIASIFMDEAVKQKVLSHKFLFYWFALEAQIGQGEARRKFCEEELGSTTVSAEMKRLHQIRSDIAHGLKTVNIDKEDIHRLLELIRIGTLDDGPIRQNLVGLFQTSLLKQE